MLDACEFDTEINRGLFYTDSETAYTVTLNLTAWSLSLDFVPDTKPRHSNLIHFVLMIPRMVLLPDKLTNFDLVSVLHLPSRIATK